MSIVKQEIQLIFEESIPLNNDFFMGSSRNIGLLMPSIETAVEASPDVTISRPPDVHDADPIVESRVWVGISVVFNRKSLIKGGIVVKPEEIQKVVEQELEIQDFDDVEITDRNIRIGR